MGSHVSSIFFVMKGQIALCEPNGDPFCILIEGCTYGEYQVLNRVPSFSRICVPNEIDLIAKFDGGKPYYVKTESHGLNKSICHVMCCDSYTFLELCDLHPQSA